jgi:carboxymethylenebutenolidase
LAVLPHEGTHSILYGPFPVPVGSGYATGYLARPDEAGRFPAVLLIPGLEGIGGHEKDVARRLARHGFVCLVVATHHGEADYHRTGDRPAMFLLDEAHAFLQTEDNSFVVPGRSGVLGIDVGGRLALMAAAHRNWVGAAVVVSTPLTGDEERETQVASLLPTLGVPVLGLYGSADLLIAADTVDEAQRRNAAGQWLLYEGAGHGFFDDNAPDFDPAAAADAFARTVAFLQACLPPAQPEDLG